METDDTNSGGIRKHTEELPCITPRLFTNLFRMGAAYVCLCLFACVASAVEDTGTVIGTQAQLFVDDVMVARKEGVIRKAHACRKLDQPVLTADKPWERTDIDRRIYVYGTALPQEDGSGYRLWYMRFSDILQYATSEDGLHWEQHEKNPVLPGGDTCTLAYDPENRGIPRISQAQCGNP